MNEKGPFICDMCGSKYQRRSFLIFHLKSHQGSFNMLCDLCSQFFNRKDALIRHMEKHHMKRRFKCKICEYKSCHKKHLREHMLRHGPKAKCKVCHKLFSNLRRHMTSHPKAERPVATKNKVKTQAIAKQPRDTCHQKKASQKWSLKWIPKMSP